MPTTDAPAVVFSTETPSADNSNPSSAPYGLKKDGSPRKKPGRKTATERRAAAKKAPAKKAPAKKQQKNDDAAEPQRRKARVRKGRSVRANNQPDIRPGQNGKVVNGSMNHPKRGFTEAEAIEMLRVGYSVEHIAKHTGYAVPWLNRQKVPRTSLLERVTKKPA